MWNTPSGHNIWRSYSCSNYTSRRNVTAVCMGTCRSLIDDLIANCPNTSTAFYSNTISTLCNGGTNTGNCETAYSAVGGTCIQSLNNNDASVCTGTCGTQLSAAVTACGSNTDSQIQAIVSTYSRLCGSEEQCMAALQALEDEPSCQSSTDPSVIYSGTCTTLHFASIDACPDADATTARQAYNAICGSGNILKASGVITLLFVAMLACIYFLSS